MKRIFYADDDKDEYEVFNIATKILEVTAEVTFAKDGLELLQLLKDNLSSLPDYVFIDLNMPLMNGHECIQEIRKDDKLKNLCVVILTTSRDQRDIDEAFAEGADYYLCKTSSIYKLEQALKKLFSLDCNHRKNREYFVLN